MIKQSVFKRQTEIALKVARNSGCSFVRFLHNCVSFLLTCIPVENFHRLGYLYIKLYITCRCSNIQICLESAYQKYIHFCRQIRVKIFLMTKL